MIQQHLPKYCSPHLTSTSHPLLRHLKLHHPAPCVMSPTWRSLFFALHLPLGSVLHRIPVASRVYLISCSRRSGRGSKTDRSIPRFSYFCFLFVTRLPPADFCGACLHLSCWALQPPVALTAVCRSALRLNVGWAQTLGRGLHWAPPTVFNSI